MLVDPSLSASGTLAMCSSSPFGVVITHHSISRKKRKKKTKAMVGQIAMRLMGLRYLVMELSLALLLSFRW